jgi:hypothetical protein
MSAPFFSIVIPTRNRGYELFYTLKTCVEQDLPEKHGRDFEIVVSDNASTDDIRAVVGRIASPRVRYVATGRYLSMTESWEFAVSQARGDYVGVVCTDDGYLLDTLSKVFEIVQRTGAEAVTFQGAYYNWPNSPDPRTRNTLRIPRFIFPERLEESTQLVKDALRNLHYGRLPCFLNSFCKRDAIDRVRAKSGRIFASFQPDVYAAFLMGGSLPRIYVSNRIMLIGGVSGQSTGGNSFNNPESSVAKEHMDQFKGETLTPGLPDVLLAGPYIVDSAVKALAAAGWPDDVLALVDFRSMMLHSYRHATTLARRDQRRAALRALRDYMNANPAARVSSAWLMAKRLQWAVQDSFPVAIWRVLQGWSYRLGRSTGALAVETIDATTVGIANVYDAAKFVTSRLATRSSK